MSATFKLLSLLKFIKQAKKEGKEILIMTPKNTGKIGGKTAKEVIFDECNI